MAERDFDYEFSHIMAPIAAEDPELIAHYQAKMNGAQPGMEDWEVETMIRVQYDQTPASYKLAVARCIGKIAGVKFGSEIFRGKA